MKKTLFIFSLSSLMLACTGIQTGYAQTSKQLPNKPIIPSVHFTAKQSDCIKAEATCLLRVTPSKWQVGERSYDVERICDYDAAQAIYNVDMFIKDQVTKRQFLAKEFCQGTTTLSDMDLPFAKNTKEITDANDGTWLMKAAEDGIARIEEALGKATLLANKASQGVYSSSQLSDMNTSFQMLIDETNRVAYNTYFNNMSLLDKDSIIQVPIHHQTAHIPIQLTDLTNKTLGIEDLGIQSLESAQKAAEKLIQVMNKVILAHQALIANKQVLEVAAKQDAQIIKVDLRGPQFVVTQENG